MNPGFFIRLQRYIKATKFHKNNEVNTYWEHTDTHFLFQECASLVYPKGPSNGLSESSPSPVPGIVLRIGRPLYPSPIITAHEVTVDIVRQSLPFGRVAEITKPVAVFPKCFIEKIKCLVVFSKCLVVSTMQQPVAMDGAELLPASRCRRSDCPIHTHFTLRKMLHTLHSGKISLCINAFL